MTLTEIKNNVINQLKGMTIDDYWANPMVIAGRSLKLNKEEEIKEYLLGKMNEIDFRRLQWELNDRIRDYNNELKDLENDNQKIREKISKIISEIDELKEEKDSIAKIEKQLQDELIVIQKGLVSFKELNLDKLLEKSQHEASLQEEKKNKELSKIENKLKWIKEKVESLESEKNALEQAISSNETKVLDIMSNINNEQQQLDKLEGRRSFFEEEYLALEFLSIFFIKKKVSDLQSSMNINPAIDEFDEIAIIHAKCENVIPGNWREIIYNYLSLPVTEISGKRTVRYDILNEDRYKSRIKELSVPLIKRDKMELTNTDLSTLLATKIAAKWGHYIISGRNVIVLNLTGGIAVKVTFREKGTIVSRFQEKPFEIFVDGVITGKGRQGSIELNSDFKHLQNLYIYNGVPIEVPIGYYLLTEQYVIELKYFAAPILFDSNRTLINAEEIEKKRIEEERRALDDDD